MPNRILIPPNQFGDLSMRIISISGVAGGTSVLKYVKDNNVLQASGLGELEILPLKWCIGAGAGGTIGTTGTVDRMVVYTNDEERVRYPMTVLNRTPVQYSGIHHLSTYFCKLGVVEVVYPETVGFFDGI